MNLCVRCGSNFIRWSRQQRAIVCFECDRVWENFYERWEFDLERSTLKLSTHTDPDTEAPRLTEATFTLVSFDLHRDFDTSASLVFQLFFGQPVRPNQPSLQIGHGRIEAGGKEIFAELIESRIIRRDLPECCYFSDDPREMWESSSSMDALLTLRLRLRQFQFLSHLNRHSLTVVTEHQANPAEVENSAHRYVEHLQEFSDLISRTPLGRTRRRQERVFPEGFSDSGWFGAMPRPDHFDPSMVLANRDSFRLPRETPSTLARPDACIGCIDYHGHTYAGMTETGEHKTHLVCGLHPYGWTEGGDCPDWRGRKQQPIDAAAEEIAKRLGLQPLHSFAAGREDQRCSGRTTKMVCQALAEVLGTGEVALIVAHSESMCKYLQNMVAEYAEILQIPLSWIVVSTRQDALRMVRHRVFKDHVVDGDL